MCSSCLLYSYASGTLTPLATYQTVTLTPGTEHTNPIELNAAGKPPAPIFLSANSYKFVLKSAALVTIDTADTIAATHVGVTGVVNTGDITLQVDSDNNGSNKFSFLDGAGTEKAQINESGNLQLDGTLQVDSSATIAGTLAVTGLLTAPLKNWTYVNTTATGTQNNFDPGIVGNTVVRCNNASALTITGFLPATAQVAGQMVLLEAINSTVGLTHQATSTAANQLFNIATSADTPLAAGGHALYVYDGTTLRWRLASHEQGAWITPTFAAGTFTANGAQSWTVASGDVTTSAYRLVGKTLQFNYDIVTSTVGGTPNTQLIISNAAYGGFTWAKTVLSGAMAYSDNGGGATPGLFQITAAGTNVSNFKAGAGNWTAATDTTTVSGTLVAEVN